MGKKVEFLVFFCALSVAFCEVSDNNVRQGKIGFIKGATAMLSSLAQDMVTRSAASSQAVIFGAGAFGYGHGTYARSTDGPIKANPWRSLDFNEILPESELFMILSYLKADSTQDYGCLQRIACEEPRKAEEYVFTGRLFLKGSEFFREPRKNSKYEKAISHVEEAVSSGLKGQNCMERYRCELD